MCIKTITAYQDSKGGMYPLEVTALIAEGSIQTGIPLPTMTNLFGHAAVMVPLLTRYIAALAENAGEKEASPEANHPIDQDPIPANIYYSQEGGNFYDSKKRTGQGQEFMDRWFSRRNEFPADAKAACRIAISQWLAAYGYVDVDDFNRRASYDQKAKFTTFMATQPDFEPE